MSKRTLRPGETADVQMKYIAPRRTGDHQQLIRISFKEDDAEDVVLRTRASTRGELSVSRDNILIVVPTGQSARLATQEFIVSNYSDSIWSGLNVESTHGAVESNVQEVPVATIGADQQSAPVLRQSWRVVLRSALPETTTGRFRDKLTISAKGVGAPKNIASYTAQVATEILAEAMVVPIPSRLFLGEVSSVYPTSATVRIRIQDAKLAQRFESVRVLGTPSIRVRADLQSGLGRYRDVRLQFDFGNVTTPTINETITIELSAPAAEHEFTLPVFGILTV